MEIMGRKIPRHVIVAGSGWLGRATEAGAQLVAIPLLIAYLGTDDYAIFSVLTSLVVWFNLVDMGLGPSLQNYLTEARTKAQDPRPLLGAALFLVLAIFIVSLTILALVHEPFEAWILARLSHQAGSRRSGLLLLIGPLFLASSLGGVAYRAWYARHQGYLANVFQGLARVLALAGLAGAYWVYSGDHRLELALGLWAGPPALLALLASWRLYDGARPGPVPVDIGRAKALLGRGATFGAYAAMTAAIVHIDYLVMAQTLSLVEVVQYNILNKVFSFLLVLYWAMLMAIWPELTEKFAAGQWASARRLIRRYQLWGGVLLAGGTVAVLVGVPILVTWFMPGSGLVISRSSILFFGLFFLTRAWSDTYATVLMSLSRLRIIWFYVPFQAGISLAGQYYLSIHFGLNGILWGLIASFAFTAVWILPLEFRAVGREQDRPERTVSRGS